MQKWLSNKTISLAGDSHLRFMHNYLSVLLGGEWLQGEGDYL